MSESTPPSSLQVASVLVGGVPYAVIALGDTPHLQTPLTLAEQAIMPLLMSGTSTRDIARLRNVAERTISNQLASIYRKLGVGSRSSLVALASSGVPPAK